MSKEYGRLVGGIVALSLFISPPALATGSVLSGIFDGYEPAIRSLVHADGCSDKPWGYRQSTFQVTESGTYFFNDAFGSLRDVGGLDVTASVYEGSFSATAPGEGLIATASLDYPANEVALTAGTTYTLVVQLACVTSKGAWAVAFAGPGTVNSDDAAVVPSFTSGDLAEGAGTMNSLCTDAWGPYRVRYKQTGPIRVSRTGTYYFSTAGIYSLCLSVYSAPVDPGNEWVNFVGGGYGEEFELEAGRDYYVLVQSHGDNYGFTPFAVDEPGDYFFVMAPPATFRLSRGLADSWYNPETPGQGFFLDVFEDLNQAFLGWFTYAVDAPVDDELGHRWMTALGSFAGTSANLAVEWTAKGGFDSASPVPHQYQDGSIELEFTDCTSGQITYHWSGGPDAQAMSGVIPIQRLHGDSVELCEWLYRGPGMPGPM